MTFELQEREPTGIRELLDQNPVAGEPRKGVKRFWTGREEKLLRLHYPIGGVSLCLQHLPGRTASSIYNRVGQLGLRIALADGKAPQDRTKWETSLFIDGLIKTTYQTRPDKMAVQNCSNVVGRPRWWVSKRAAQLGLVTPRFKELPWSEAEIEFISDNAHKTPCALRRLMTNKGFARSETAISLKIKRLHLDRTDPHHLNANQLSEAMGVDRKTVGRWIEKGLLKAKRRESTDTDDFWWIHRKHVRAFIEDNVAIVDVRKVDKFWFIDLLTDNHLEGKRP